MRGPTDVRLDQWPNSLPFCVCCWNPKSRSVGEYSHAQEPCSGTLLRSAQETDLTETEI